MSTVEYRCKFCGEMVGSALAVVVSQSTESVKEAAHLECLADELTYRSYRHNRQLFPEIEAERWRLAFSQVLEFEKRFDLERLEAAMGEEPMDDPPEASHGDWIEAREEGGIQTEGSNNEQKGQS